VSPLAQGICDGLAVSVVEVANQVTEAGLKEALAIASPVLRQALDLAHQVEADRLEADRQRDQAAAAKRNEKAMVIAARHAAKEDERRHAQLRRGEKAQRREYQRASSGCTTGAGPRPTTACCAGSSSFSA
jgi:hypothetical protein